MARRQQQRRTEEEPKQSVLERIAYFAALIAIVGVAGGVIWIGQRVPDTGPDPGEEAAVPFQDLAPVKSVQKLKDGGGWVAEVEAGWGEGDLASAQDTCDTIFRRLGGRKGDQLTLVGTDGTPVVECGTGVDAVEGGPRLAQ